MSLEKRCEWILITGKNKGTSCSKSSMTHERFCSNHIKKGTELIRKCEEQEFIEAHGMTRDLYQVLEESNRECQDLHGMNVDEWESKLAIDKIREDELKYEEAQKIKILEEIALDKDYQKKRIQELLNDGLKLFFDTGACYVEDMTMIHVKVDPVKFTMELSDGRMFQVGLVEIPKNDPGE
jgi:hypothetical protein